MSRYMWVVPCKTPQDCVVDQRLDHKSELLAVTTSLDFHWYSISECALQSDKTSSPERATQQDVLPIALKVELLAVLKKTELCTKLRKLDFREYFGDSVSSCTVCIMVIVLVL